MHAKKDRDEIIAGKRNQLNQKKLDQWAINKELN